MRLLQKRVAVVGHPDIGKSRFIKEAVEAITGKEISPDTLMHEVHWSNGKDPYGNPDTRTIKCAKIMFQYKGHEFCFYDCPGHLEYIDQIKQGTKAAHSIIYLYDSEHSGYLESIGINKDRIDLITLYPRSEEKLINHYNFDNHEGRTRFYNIINDILESIINKKYNDNWVDLEEEAISNIKSLNGNNNIILYSGGKDSVVGKHILDRAGIKYDLYFPCSGFDFPEVVSFINDNNTKINYFDNSGGKTYSKNSAYEMMIEKANANNNLIKLKSPDNLFVNYRASDEGVRSKDYWINDSNGYNKVSPVFYFSELDIWKYIKKYNLPICDLYFKGYRSLGDMPVTDRCMPSMTSIDDIITWLENNPNTRERDGRKAQDNSENFAMEKLRNVGFF